MFFVIDDKSGELLLPKMKNWKKLDYIINSNSDLKNNRPLFLAHQTVRTKLEAAYMHIVMLKQSYEIRDTAQTKIGPTQVNLLRRTMFDNIIFNLSSLLDSIAHEINQIYKFNINFKIVQMDHVWDDKLCIRCKLDKEKDELAAHLNWELPRKLKNSVTYNTSWYRDFSGYRNQIMHRTIYFLHMTPGRVYVPDDPTILDFQGMLFDENHRPIFKRHHGDPLMKNFENQREMRVYSIECFKKILEITEKVYGFLIDKKSQK